MHRVAGRAAEDCGAHLAQDANLTLGVAGRGGNDRGARGKRAVVGAQATREEAIAIGNLYHVCGTAVRKADAAGEAV